jgi:hypothetical protein
MTSNIINNIYPRVTYNNLTDINSSSGNVNSNNNLTSNNLVVGDGIKNIKDSNIPISNLITSYSNNTNIRFAYISSGGTVSGDSRISVIDYSVAGICRLGFSPALISNNYIVIVSSPTSTGTNPGSDVYTTTTGIRNTNELYVYCQNNGSLIFNGFSIIIFDI